MMTKTTKAGLRLACLCLIASLGFGAPVHAEKLAPGDVRTTLELGFPNSPEGIAFDKRGNMFVGNRFLDFAASKTLSRIIKVRRNGTMSTFATLPDLDVSGIGVLGLVTDRRGNVYAAFNSGDEATSGIWRINRRGTKQKRLAGSEKMIFPNALTFDDHGNLYATDSFGGSIWRFPAGGHHDDGSCAEWAQDFLLTTTFIDTGFGPLPGANGIAFFPPNHLYIANTDRNIIVGIDIADDGSAGAAQVIAGVPSPDGVAVDAHGDIYTVIPPAVPLFFSSPVVRIDRATMGFVPIVIDPALLPNFNLTLSLAFGRGKGKRSVFVTNGALLGPIEGIAGPGVVEVGIGVRGYNPFAH